MSPTLDGVTRVVHPLVMPLLVCMFTINFLLVVASYIVSISVVIWKDFVPIMTFCVSNGTSVCICSLTE